mmetsp:Transcript_3345/g.4697  ORF Transcript_3345/g.4697 Transcript_3345/m.4697 type:complete len:83 (+) Transcript_3345:660-908(+)
MYLNDWGIIDFDQVLDVSWGEFSELICKWVIINFGSLLVYMFLIEKHIDGNLAIRYGTYNSNETSKWFPNNTNEADSNLINL